MMSTKAQIASQRFENFDVDGGVSSHCESSSVSDALVVPAVIAVMLLITFLFRLRSQTASSTAARVFVSAKTIWI